MTSETKKRRSSLAWRLYAGLLAVSFSTAGIAGTFVDNLVRKTAVDSYKGRLDAQVTTFGQMTASALFGELDPNDTSMNPPVHALAESVHTHLSLVAMSGAPVADSAVEDPRTTGSQSGFPEVQQATKSGTGFAIRNNRMWTALRIDRDGKPLGIARASVEMKIVDEYVSSVRKELLTSAGIAALVALLLATFITLGIVRPVQRLADGARRIGDGDLAFRVEVAGNDELADLGNALNEMTVNLQKMIAQLDKRNQDMRVVLDNVNQGLVTGDRSGVLQAERSAMVERWFGPIAPGTKLWDLFTGTSTSIRDLLAASWDQAFDDILPIEVSIGQLPVRFTQDDRIYELSYEPIMAGETIEKLLVVISDITARVQAEAAEARQRDLMAIFEAIERDRGGFQSFLREGDTLMASLRELNRPKGALLARLIHTLKGSSSLFGLHRLGSLCHDIENRFAENPAGAELTDTDVASLQLLWSELQQRASAFLAEQGDRLDVRPADVSKVIGLVESGAADAAILRQLRSWQMERIEGRLQRLGEKARQLAKNLGRETPQIEVDTGGLRLDSMRWDAFWSAMSHVVRNAVDHGLEPGEERVKSGKAAQGKLAFSTRVEGEEIIFEIRDDGRGVSWDRLREKAQKAGLPFATRDDLIAAMFTDSVSTRDAVSETSGRGVGLAAVMESCKSLGGKIEVDSVGAGTTFRFRFPGPALQFFQPTMPPPSEKPVRA